MRIYQLAKAIANQGHRVFLLMPSNYPEEKYLHDRLSIHKVAPLVPVSILDVFRRRAYDLRNIRLSLLQSLFSMVLLKKVDVIQSEELSVSLVSLLVSLITRTPHILDAHNVEYILSRQFSNSNTWLTRGYKYLIERLLCRMSDKVIAVSESDKQELCRLYSVRPKKISVIPNGVNLHDCLLSKKLDREQLGLPENWLVVFHGKLDYYPNTLAVREIVSKIAPLVREKLPDTNFLVIGKKYPLEVTNEAMIFPGFVHNLYGYLKTTDAALVPIRLGSGTRLKILEYFACGIPVVTTSVGVAGLPVVKGKHVLIGDTSEELADALISLLTNRELASRLSQNAMQFVQSYDWNNLIAGYSNILSGN